jgi:hypothetical protein
MPVSFVAGKHLSRRGFLRGTGVALGLPLLDAMRPAFAREAAAPRRMLAVCNNLGLVPEHFFPADAGRGYKPSPCLELLQGFRDDFTVFGGVSHPDVDGGHPADICFLTAAPHPSNGGFRNTISLDQYAAERVGHHTRFPSLTLGVNVGGGPRSLSWTGAGVMVPCDESAADVFKKLFLQGSKAEVADQLRRLDRGKSVMDAVAGQVTDLRRGLGPADRDRLDQYLTGVRDLEKRIDAAKEWEARPKPVVAAGPPDELTDPKEYLEKARRMLAVARLAFETDSTRLVTLMLDSVSSPAIRVPGVDLTDGYHALSHHGKSEKKLAQLKALDEAQMRLLADLFGDLKAKREGGEPLLDRTMVLYGSNMGNANTHVTTNLPVLLAGGGFRHAGHLQFDREKNYPLPNLFVTMLQRLGVGADVFASSTGTMRGLEAKG